MDNTPPAGSHGMLIAYASLLRSLVAILPIELLQALLLELEQDTEAGLASMGASPIPDRTRAVYQENAHVNLELVRDLLLQKEAMQTDGE